MLFYLRGMHIQLIKTAGENVCAFDICHCAGWMNKEPTIKSVIVSGWETDRGFPTMIKTPLPTVLFHH